jgi:hypothetical protein
MDKFSQKERDPVAHHTDPTSFRPFIQKVIPPLLVGRHSNMQTAAYATR